MVYCVNLALGVELAWGSEWWLLSNMDVKNVLQDFEEAISDVVHGAWNDWLALPSPLRARVRFLGVAQATLSQAENGLIEPSEEMIDRAVGIYELPRSFFFQSDTVYGAPVSVHSM